MKLTIAERIMYHVFQIASKSGKKNMEYADFYKNYAGSKTASKKRLY